jgi:hypothetical protein
VGVLLRLFNARRTCSGSASHPARLAGRSAVVDVQGARGAKKLKTVAALRVGPRRPAAMTIPIQGSWLPPRKASRQLPSAYEMPSCSCRCDPHGGGSESIGRGTLSCLLRFQELPGAGLLAPSWLPSKNSADQRPTCQLWGLDIPHLATRPSWRRSSKTAVCAFGHTSTGIMAVTQLS